MGKHDSAAELIEIKSDCRSYLLLYLRVFCQSDFFVGVFKCPIFFLQFAVDFFAGTLHTPPGNIVDIVVPPEFKQCETLTRVPA